MRTEVKRIDELEVAYLEQKKRNLEKRLQDVEKEIRSFASES